jgi:hypothetical protein
MLHNVASAGVSFVENPPVVGFFPIFFYSGAASSGATRN